MLWRVENHRGEAQGEVSAPRGQLDAVRDALANLVGGSLGGCIRRGTILTQGPGRLTITPLRADHAPLVVRGHAVFYTAILIHDGEDL